MWKKCKKLLKILIKKISLKMKTKASFLKNVSKGIKKCLFRAIIFKLRIFQNSTFIIVSPKNKV